MKNKSILLTVAVLTYNSESTIDACITSLVKQKNKNFKVLIVDDHSSDQTYNKLQVYKEYLEINIIQNGSHNIARGRNIALNTSGTEIVAFLDSDDSATSTWTNVIITTFNKNPDLALISGKLIPAYRTSTSQAIAFNDETIRNLFGGGALQFCTCNCAFNRKLISTFYFDEDFQYAEDLELLSRISVRHKWQYLVNMKVNHESRSTLSAYAKQMYLYGIWKFYYEFKSKEYRLIDFVPLALMFFSVIASVIFWNLAVLFSIIFFSLAESIFVIIYQRKSLKVSLLTFPAWLIKNIAWSTGIIHGMLKLLFNNEFKLALISKRTIENDKV